MRVLCYTPGAHEDLAVHDDGCETFVHAQCVMRCARVHSLHFAFMSRVCIWVDARNVRIYDDTPQSRMRTRLHVMSLHVCDDAPGSRSSRCVERHDDAQHVLCVRSVWRICLSVCPAITLDLSMISINVRRLRTTTKTTHTHQPISLAKCAPSFFVVVKTCTYHKTVKHTSHA